MTATNTNGHRYTIGTLAKARVTSEGKKLRVVLTHGWKDVRSGAKVESLYFATKAQAEKHAKAQGWAAH